MSKMMQPYYKLYFIPKTFVFFAKIKTKKRSNTFHKAHKDVVLAESTQRTVGVPLPPTASSTLKMKQMKETRS